jgi:hypothetical protein
MKIYIEGEKSKTICCGCNRWVTTTFKYGNIPFSDGVGFAKDILAGFCDSCNQVVEIPPQSTPAIRQSRAKALNSVEAIVPAALVDAINLASFEIDADFSQDFKKKAIWFFVREYAKMEKIPTTIKSDYQEKIKTFGKTRRRLSFKVSKAMLNDLEKAASLFSENHTETLKIAALDFYTKVIEKRDSKLIKKLKDIAYMA